MIHEVSDKSSCLVNVSFFAHLENKGLLTKMNTLARSNKRKISFKSITSEEDFYALDEYMTLRWLAEHMLSHYYCNLEIERYTKRLYSKQEKVLKSLEEFNDLFPPYYEKITLGIIPTIDETRNLKSKLSVCHSDLHRWAIGEID